MKTILFITIASMALLFTSCGKDEMGIGESSGGGMLDEHSFQKERTNTSTDDIVAAQDTISYPDK